MYTKWIVCGSSKDISTSRQGKKNFHKHPPKVTILPFCRTMLSLILFHWAKTFGQTVLEGSAGGNLPEVLLFLLCFARFRRDSYLGTRHQKPGMFSFE